MAKRFSLCVVFCLLAVCSGRLAASDVFIENNMEAGNVRVRITNLNDASEVLYESVPNGVFIGLSQINESTVNRYDFFVYDEADIGETNLLVYAEVWNSEIITAQNEGSTIHVSCTQGMDETSVGRIVVGNSTSVDVDWNGNTIAANSTNSFQIPSASYSLAEWESVTRPWGWLSSVRFLQPVTWSTTGIQLTDDQQMMLWLHDHDPQQWVSWYWDGALQEWAFGSIGDPNNGSGVGGGSGGGGGTGGGGGGSGGGGATGTGTITGGAGGTQTINLTLNGVALETTQLRNEIELQRIRQNSETNNITLSQMLALMNGATVPSDPQVVQEEAENQAAAQIGGIEQEADGIKGLFTRVINVPAIANGAAHDLFVIGWDAPDGTPMEIDYDPREVGGLVLVFQCFKSLVCLLVFYLAIKHCWNWYEKKMEAMAASQNTGTAGEAVLGTNANLVTSAINASIIVTVIGAISLVVIALLVSSITGSMVGAYFTETGLLDGSHSSYSNEFMIRAMVLVDFCLPINCIISACFVCCLFEVVGHYIWLGGTMVIRYANA